MTDYPSSQQKRDYIVKLLRKLDTLKTDDNPDGNPFHPGNMSVDEVADEIMLLREQEIAEARLQELKTFLEFELLNENGRVAMLESLRTKPAPNTEGLKCGHEGPDWNGEGDCITCARNKVLGEKE